MEYTGVFDFVAAAQTTVRVVVSVIDLSVGNRLFAELTNQKSELVNQEFYTLSFYPNPDLIFKFCLVTHGLQWGLTFQVSRSL